MAAEPTSEQGQLAVDCDVPASGQGEAADAEGAPAVQYCGAGGALPTGSASGAAGAGRVVVADATAASDPEAVDAEASDEDEELTSDERLLRAARWKGVAAIERLLRNRMDSDASDRWGATPLMIAARHRPPAITEALLEHGGSGGINARDSLGHTALHEACVSDNTGAVAALLEAGADWSLVNNNGETPLMTASVHGSFEAATLLLKKSPIDGLSVRDKAGNTALHHACHGRWGFMSQLLLDAGSDASAQNEHGQWPADLWTNASNYTAVMAVSKAARLEPARHRLIQMWVRRSQLVLWRCSAHTV